MDKQLIELADCDCGLPARLYHSDTSTIRIMCEKGIYRSPGHAVLIDHAGDKAGSIAFWNRSRAIASKETQS